jgi:RES domain-containing protein
LTPLPAAIGGTGELVAWRLVTKKYAKTWDDGEGSFRSGGRWNSAGVRAVYCSLDPATAILENMVNKPIETLSIVPHVLIEIEIIEVDKVHIVQPEHVVDRTWRRPGDPQVGGQLFGDRLLAQHKFVLIPSVVSMHSWNLVFANPKSAGAYLERSREDFILDPRLDPELGREIRPSRRP